MKALLLAAGRGERMGALTLDCPKPLLSIGKERLIERHVRRLKIAGIDEVVVNLYYLGHQIKSLLGDGAAYGLRVVYSEEASRLETGGGARQALSLLGTEAPFLMISSDVVTDFDFRSLTQKKPDLCSDADPIRNARVRLDLFRDWRDRASAHYLECRIVLCHARGFVSGGRARPPHRLCP